MKIGVFFLEYEPVHENKDPGQITLGLNENGIHSEVITLYKPSLDDYTSVPLRFITAAEAHSPAFWASTDYDAILAYTWLRSNYLWVPQTIKRGGKKVVVKGDTDGRVNSPLHPMWDCIVGKSLGIIPMLKIVRRRFKRNMNAETIFCDFKNHLDSSDFAIVETPQAFVNIACVLERWNEAQLLNKVEVIPNPVSPAAILSEIPSKFNQVVAIGNWEMKFGDYYVKNTKIMCSALTRFLTERPDYKATLIGLGHEFLNRLLIASSPEVKARINILGKLPNDDVLKLLSESKILFMPSISESFGIAAAEALCMGCSIVTSPIESLIYLSQGGFSGTVASNFEEYAFSGALSADAMRWDRREYRPEDISTFWRRRLDRRVIATQIVSLFLRC